MDKFEEMVQNTKKMTDAERTTMMGKNRALCICAKCPTYHDCAKAKTELLYCATGKSACTLTKKACLLHLNLVGTYGIMSHIIHSSPH